MSPGAEDRIPLVPRCLHRAWEKLQGGHGLGRVAGEAGHRSCTARKLGMAFYIFTVGNKSKEK